MAGESTGASPGGPGEGHIRVLCVDDEPGMAELTEELLERQDDALAVTTENTAADGLARLDQERFDCVVSDYQMPEMDGLAFLRAVRESSPDLPFILFTGRGSEEIASEAISAGVTDYLQKGDEEAYLVLARQIHNAVQRRRAVERFERFLASAPDSIVIVDASGTITQVNDRTCELFGYDRATLVGEPIEVLLPERYREVHVAHREAYLADPQVRPMGAELDLYARHADGSEFPVDISLSPVPVGGHLEVMAAVRDISERTWHEAALREEQAFTDSIFTAIPDVFYAFDADGQFLRWNDRLEAVTGYPADEIESMSPPDFVPDEEVEPITAAIRTVLETEGPVTIESAFETEDGRRIPYEFTGGVLRDSAGEILGIAGIGRDISDRQAREAELRRERDLVERIIQTSPVGIGVLSPDGEVLRMNERAAEILGVRPGATDAYRTGSLPVYDEAGEPIPPEATAFARVVRTGEPVLNVTVQLERTDGDRRWLTNHATPLSGDDGALEAVVVVAEDVDDLKEREQELERQNERLEAFASVVSHDLRNPLMVARGNLEFAREHGDAEAFERVAAAHDRMDDLIDSLLTLARQGRTVEASRPVGLAAVATAAWASVDGNGATLAVDVDETAELLADRERLRQALENLFRNACEHGAADGQPPSDLTVTVTATTDGFAVADDGRGIPPGEREAVFERGYAVGEGGTGYGLAIVRSIVEAHGWEITAAAGDAGGARFEVTGVEWV